MNISQIEENVKSLIKKINKESFIYDMLLAYGTPKNTITRVKKGSRNLSKNENEVVIKKKIFFAHFDKDIDQEFERLSKDSSTQKHDPRFVIATDYKTIKALDTKLDEKIEFPLKEFNKKFDFFLPLAGIEKKEFKHENPIDVKAAEKLAKLFDLIKKDNPKSDPKSLHSLNVFLTRLLFCYFAEDTDIFPQGLFTDSVGSHTQVDGSDLSEYLAKIFEIMNLEKRSKNTPDYLNNFPYVNGGLFAENHPIPMFTKKSREALLDIGDLNWAEINPDIFGSMIQAVVHPDQRAGLGMHYTSVSNIMKVIEPLFLNDLYEELEKSKKSETKLRKLLKRLSEIKIFDPACGSGNFLIIAYKELRKLEMLVYKKLPNEMKFSYIPLRNFYGIEVDDFAHEVATLSLWLAEHQMDVVFKEEFGELKPSLPLKDGGNIHAGNAIRMDWGQVCPNNEGEIYLIGNPPYLGFKMQNKSHKEDIKIIFESFKNYKKFDYIACWMYKAAKYIVGKNSRFAFVSTNSLYQGEHVGLLWPTILGDKLEFFYAHPSFRWSNNAKSNATVTCSIVGVRNISTKEKIIYNNGQEAKVKNINLYLTPSRDVVVEKRSRPLSEFPKMLLGNMPKDDGNFIFSETEKNEFLKKNNDAKQYIRELIGAKEFINSSKRFCLWIEDNDVKEAVKIKDISKRIEKVKEFRASSTDKSANQMALTPYKFREQHVAKSNSMIIPTVTSERREYIPMGFLDKNTVIVAPNNAIYDPEPYLFAILSSKMHMVWIKAVAGRLESRIRYSSVLCYNTFPFPKMDKDKKEILKSLVYKLIGVREKYTSKSIGDLYDPDKMPVELLEVHNEIDREVEQIYRKKEFSSDEERLAFLFDLYEKMIEEDNNG